MSGTLNKKQLPDIVNRVTLYGQASALSPFPFPFPIPFPFPFLSITCELKKNSRDSILPEIVILFPLFSNLR